MRNFFRGCAMAAALTSLTPASAQDRADAQPSEIVVTGARDRDEQIADFVAALTPGRVGGQLSRFEEPVCPAAIGLSPNHNKKVAARMRRVAGAAGVPVGQEGCSPNVFVVVAQDRDAMIRAIRKQWRDPLGDRVRIPDQPGPAVALHLEGLLDANGIQAGVKQDDGDGRSGYYVVESSHGGSRLTPASRPHFIVSALVVEPDVIAGLTTMQLADYAVMRLLARTDPSRLEGSTAPTILTILEAPIGSLVPASLTDWDLGFLRAFYGSAENRYANQQRTEMQRLLRNDLDKAQQQSGRE